MPFSLANALATFQAYINRVLQGLVDTICIVYLDDILIYSADQASHKRDVHVVLERLLEAQLYVKLSKCEFMKNKVNFLGFVVDPDGVAMEPDRVATIVD